MDGTEARVLTFLRSRGFTDICYEPDGNIPPDFVSDGIAVEARRLNQHDNRGRGLEESTAPLVMRFRNLLKSLGPASGGASWFVTFRYRRPVRAWGALAPKIGAALSSFDGDSNEGVIRIEIDDWFSMGLARASEPLGSRFVLGGYTDHDAGGWIVSEMIRNLGIVIPEKSKKVEPFRSRYREWWLVLLDQIGYARLEPHEIDTLRQIGRASCRERV